jgi:hypothetical protein
MPRKYLLILFTLFIFALPAFAQTASGNLIDKVDLRFDLNADPTPADVGFDNPKSSWKLKYTLYLIDFSELEKIGRCRKDEVGRHLCLPGYDTKLDKKIRKNSIKLQKGSFSKKSLSNEANREITIPVNLQPKIIEIFNQATKTPEKNPSLILFIDTKASLKTSGKGKVKRKYSTNGIQPLKMASSNKMFEYWDVKNISTNLTIAKGEDGQIKKFSGMIH